MLSKRYYLFFNIEKDAQKNLTFSDIKKLKNSTKNCFKIRD